MWYRRLKKRITEHSFWQDPKFFKIKAAASAYLITSIVYKSLSFVGYELDKKFRQEDQEQSIEPRYIVGVGALFFGLLAGSFVLKRLYQDEILQQQLIRNRDELIDTAREKEETKDLLQDELEYFTDWLIILSSIKTELSYLTKAPENEQINKINANLDSLGNLLTAFIAQQERLPNIAQMQMLTTNIAHLPEQNLQADRRRYNPFHKRMPYINALIAASRGLAAAFVSDIAQNYIFGKNPDETQKWSSLIIVCMSAVTSFVAGYFEVDSLSSTINHTEQSRVILEEVILEGGRDLIKNIKSYSTKAELLDNYMKDIATLLNISFKQEIFTQIQVKLKEVEEQYVTAQTHISQFSIFAKTLPNANDIQVNIIDHMLEKIEHPDNGDSQTNNVSAPSSRYGSIQ